MSPNPLRVVQRNFLANVNKVHWYPVLPMVRKQAKYNEPFIEPNSRFVRWRTNGSMNGNKAIMSNSIITRRSISTLGLTNNTRPIKTIESLTRRNSTRSLGRPERLSLKRDGNFSHAFRCSYRTTLETSYLGKIRCNANFSANKLIIR